VASKFLPDSGGVQTYSSSTIWNAPVTVPHGAIIDEHALVGAILGTFDGSCVGRLVDGSIVGNFVGSSVVGDSDG